MEVMASPTTGTDVVMANYRDPACGIDSIIYWGLDEGLDPGERTTLATVGAYDVAVADFDLDGHPDLVFARLRDEAGFDV